MNREPLPAQGPVDVNVKPCVVPITLAQAKAFIAQHHRHNKPPTGWKFGVGLQLDGALVGVATDGRPVARHYDDGLTLEVNKTCTDGLRPDPAHLEFKAPVLIKIEAPAE